MAGAEDLEEAAAAAWIELSGHHSSRTWLVVRKW